MASVGTAYVTIRIDTKGVERSLDSMLARLSAKMDASGTKLGRDFTNGLNKTDWNSGFSGLSAAADKASKDAVRSLDRVESKVTGIGDHADSTGDALSNSFSRADRSASQLHDTLGDVSSELSTAATASRRIDFSGGGGGGGSAALRKAGDDANWFSQKLKELGPEAERNRAIMSRLFDLAAFGGTALTGLVGGLSAAAGGIFALGANAASALPALSALGTGMIGLAQVGGTLAISMAGVGNAIGAGFKQAAQGVPAVTKATNTASDSAKRAVEAAKKAIDNAKEALASAREGLAGARADLAATIANRDAIKEAKDAVADAAQGIVDAKDDLKAAYRDAAWAAADANKRTVKAEQALAAAQGKVTAAQQRLNDARAEAIEQLEDIGFRAEDAALGEQRAELALEDAFAKLQEVSQLAPDDRARREAELAYAEAELNLRQAKDAREDADAAQQQAAETGIEGTQAMVDAQGDLVDAQQEQVDATEDLAEARQEEARTAIENAEAIADAQRDVADAHEAHRDALNGVIDAQNEYRKSVQDAREAVADAADGVRDAKEALAEANQGLADAKKRFADLGGEAAAAAGPINAFEQALKNLSPAQQEFVRRLVDMREKFLDARNQIADPLFQGLNRALTDVVQGGMFDLLVDQLTGTSEALGDVISNNRKGMDSFGELVKNPVFQGSLRDVMESNNKSITNFGQAGVYLADAFVQVADAAAPLLEEFSKWVEQVTKSWSETTRAKNATGDLGGTFQTAADRIKEFWGLAKEVWRTLSILGEAANKAANNFGDMGREGEEAKEKFGFITFLTDNLSDFNDKLEGTTGKSQGFKQALRTLSEAGGAVKTLVIDPLIALATDKDLERAFRTLGSPEVSDNMKRLSDTAGDAAPVLANIAADIIDIVASMSESGAIEHFLDIIKQISGVLKTVVGFLGDSGVLALTGQITGSLAAFRLLRTGLKFGVSPFIGMADSVKGFIDNMRTAKGDAKGFKGIFAGLKGGLGFGAAAPKVAGAGGEATDKTWEGQVIRGLTAIKIAIDTCCLKLETAMGRAGAAGAAGGIGGAAGRAGPRITGPAAAATMGAGAAGDIAKAGRFAKVLGVFSRLGPALGGVFKILGGGLRVVGVLFRLALGPIGMIVFTLLPILWPLLVKLEEKTGIFSKSLDVLKTALGKVGEFFVFLWDKIKELFNWVKDNWPLLLAIITGPIGLAVFEIIKHWDDIKAAVSSAVDFVKGLLGNIWDGITEGWDKISTFFGDLWPVHLQPKIQALVDSAKALLLNIWDGIKTAWWTLVGWSDILENWVKEKIQGLVTSAGNVLKNIWDKITDVWNKTIKPFFTGLWGTISDKVSNLITSAGNVLQNIWDKITNVWNNQIVPFFSGLWGTVKDLIGSPGGGGLIGKATDALASIWDKITNVWTNQILPFFRGLWNEVDNIITGPNGFITKFSNAIGGIWEGLKSGFKTVWNDWIVPNVNNFFIDGINKILDLVNVPNVPGLQRMAEGGPVKGPGGPKSDRVLRLLSNGEYVLPTSSARSIGQPALEYMRKHGQVPPTGGLFGWAKDKWSDLKDAIASGAEAGFQWALSKIQSVMGGRDDIMTRILLGTLSWAGDEFAGFGAKKDREMAAAAAAAGGHVYTGPPGGWTKPVYGYYISQYPNSGHSPSWAVDLAVGNNTPVYAASRGVVSVARQLTTSYGHHLILSHAGGQTTLYAHLLRFTVRAGQQVRTGQLIGYSDTTGNSTGPHLHFELRPSSSTIAAMAAHGVQLAAGGVVSASPRGTLALLAEAGRSERVTPLDREGFTPAERRIIELLEQRMAGGSGGDTYHIQPSTPINEAALADMVSRRVAWNRRRGARAG